ncbi:META domain-containing protein [Corynebacterium testudinoris]|uniref:META domain protein n=1 Tax=Corynebacterium testudinoris TaxID=136857 RepID=A0A0G3H8R9_9CORY|nr:META domain protein [Corynebacterium testudinoris]MBX8995677.1 META domain-containing protein [Corynebacterium testudinoris]
MRIRSFVVGATVVGLAVALPVMLAACRGPASISDIDWHLETDRNASFRIEGDKLSGTDSCNRIFGEAVISSGDPASIEFGLLGSTRMACPDTTNAQEDVRKALNGQRLVEQPDTSTLVLVDAATNERWRFVQ